ncbi:MAG: type II toxin-antitoxin system VapC family toxin [Planctomycetes bacterium]|nr:type II toxin-antitoxin system VapC family toxin [Planctomycetota bacterium]
MNVVDSSGWLEYFTGGPNAGFFAQSIEDIEHLLVPALSLYEVFKRVQQQAGEGEAIQAVAAMQQGTVIDLTASLAFSAAHLSLEEGLPLASSVMLAAARSRGAIFWTQDGHFKDVAGVRYIERRAP